MSQHRKRLAVYLTKHVDGANSWSFRSRTLTALTRLFASVDSGALRLGPVDYPERMKRDEFLNEYVGIMADVTGTAYCADELHGAAASLVSDNEVVPFAELVRSDAEQMRTRASTLSAAARVSLDGIVDEFVSEAVAMLVSDRMRAQYVIVLRDAITSLITSAVLRDEESFAKHVALIGTLGLGLPLVYLAEGRWLVAEAA